MPECRAKEADVSELKGFSFSEIYAPRLPFPEKRQRSLVRFKVFGGVALVISGNPKDNGAWNGRQPFEAFRISVTDVSCYDEEFDVGSNLDIGEIRVNVRDDLNFQETSFVLRRAGLSGKNRGLPRNGKSAVRKRRFAFEKNDV